MHGFHNGTRRRRQSARRHFRSGQRAAALRALTGAKLYLSGTVSTLAAAAASCGSNIIYIQAAITLIKSEDQALLNRVLAGTVPLLAAAAQVQRVAQLVAAYRGALPQDLAELGARVGPGEIWDRIIATNI